MKNKLFLGLTVLGLMGNAQNSQAGFIDWAWNNRQVIVTGVVVAAAAYYWLTQEDDQPRVDLDVEELERDAQLRSISPSKFAVHKRSHSPKGTDPDSPTPYRVRFAAITEESDADSE